METQTHCKFSVCPHDTAKNVPGWFLLNTYLQRKLGCSMHFEPCDNFNAERERVLGGGYHLVYANPYSALIFAVALGFVPVAKPIGVFDETLLVAREGAALPSGQLRVASATDRLIVHMLGLMLLEQQGIPRQRCEINFVGTHLKAVQALVKGEADLAFVFDETWDGLSDSTRQTLRVLAETQTRQAYHCVCIAPEWPDKRDLLQQVLCGMQDDPRGRAVLDDLHLQGFEALPPDALNSLQTLVEQISSQTAAATAVSIGSPIQRTECTTSETP